METNMTPDQHIAEAEAIVAKVYAHLGKRLAKMGQQQAQELALAQVHATLAVAKQNREAGR